MIALSMFTRNRNLFKKNIEFPLYTVGFYGGKSRENHLFRLYFLKISFCNLQKVVYHRLIPHLVKITTSNVVFYTPSKNTIRMGGKFLNLHSLIFSLLLFYTQKTAPKSY
jgi:hypothetical protein